MGDWLSTAALPATKAAAGKVRAQLNRADAYTSIVDDYKVEKNSQEIFKYCLEQSMKKSSIDGKQYLDYL